jgi:hypothetical protein
MALPLVTDVLAFLGQPAGEGGDAQVQSHLDTATAMVRAYVRENGFLGGEPTEDLAAVIISSAARLHRNPTLDRTQSAGPFTHTPGTFNGWTLPELAILHRYRRRAQ